ncbi:hypothetical protein NBRC116599_44080 [Aquicoccus sp. SU-CL01552]
MVGVEEKLRRPVKGHVQVDQKGARSRALEDHREVLSPSSNHSIHLRRQPPKQLM